MKNENQFLRARGVEANRKHDVAPPRSADFQSPLCNRQRPETSMALGPGDAPQVANLRYSRLQVGATGLLRSVATLLLLILSLTPACAFVYENANEFTATGDFDGDGREDIVIVDRTTGNYRVAHQPNVGQHAWANTRASGVENVSGFGLGHLINASRDALAFTAPDANRLNVLDANSPSVAGLPLSVFTPTIGPNLVVALDIGGAGNTPLDDLFVSSIYNSGLALYQLSLMRNNAGAFTPLGANLALPAPFTAGNPVTVKSGVPQMAGGVLRGPASDTFRAYNLAAGTMLVAIQLGSLPTNSTYAHANFTGAALAQFLFYQPGDTNGALRRRSVLEPTPGNFTFSAETVFNLGGVIQQVFILPQPATAKLLVLFGNGQLARVYDFNGVNAPTLAQEFAAANGEHFTGAAPFAHGDFTMLSAPAGATTSSQFQTFNSNGGQYVAGQSGALPALTALSGLANVFQFETEPFVAPTPNLLRTLNAGDWTTRFNTQSLPQVTATVEAFISVSNGLDNPAPVALGTAHPLMHFGLVNQYTAPLSLFSLAKPVGDEVIEVKVAPPPGEYKTGINVSLAANTAGAQILYRLNNVGNWTLYAAPIALFKDTTVSYYAKPPAGNTKSVIRHAAYSFTEPPSELDSDGDGVPDYVELAKGLNPRGGPDSDGDGYSDLDELLQGTNPADANSKPPARLELKASLDFVETPRPLDGALNVTTVSATNTALRVYDLPGALMRYGTTTNLNVPGALNPSVLLSNVVIDTRQRLLTLATEQHFDIDTPGADKSLGRELLGLRPVPDVMMSLAVNYNYAGGGLTTEANNWIAAAQAAAANVTHETFVEELGIYDTLAALLVEKKISEVLFARGNTYASNLTLFPFRPTDNTRASLAQSNLLAIESLGPNGEPAFQLRAIYSAATNGVTPPTAFNAPLRAVAAEIYRISSVSNNSAPGKFPSPVDTLRNFLGTGILHSNYLAATVLPGVDLTAAHTAAQQLLASIGSRPTTNMTLLVRADTFTSDCVPLDPLVGAGAWNLFLPNGDPFRLLENFSLPPGSQVHVLGFTDIPNHGCAGQPLEVIALSLESVPAVSSTDADGDLLPDDLEMLLFGSLNQSGAGDTDSDGISNLQESFDGTDLTDTLSKASFALNVGPPQIQLGAIGGQLKLNWEWPEAYANKIGFNVFASGDLGQPFDAVPVMLSHLGGGHFEATLPNSSAPAQFYQLSLSLK